MPGAEQRDVVLAGRPQDLSDLRDERLDVVADAALAELAKARKIAADLRRVDVRVVRQLLRADRLLAHLLRLREHLQVARQTRGDAEREALGAPSNALRRELARARRRFSVAHLRDSRRSRRAASSTKKSNSSSPSSTI